MTRPRGVSRSTLLSLITITTMLAFFATGATFAVWNGGSATGSVTASSGIQLVLTGSAEGVLGFTGPTSSCPSTLSPGDFCQQQVTITNSGSNTITLQSWVSDFEVTDSAPLGCDATDWTVSISTPGALSLVAGGETTMDVAITLDADARDGCKGETATVTVTVSAA